ncbi:MAG: hypothetical protein COB78_00205 [Hyphomicrobiales bacterium]|nr:MAG: hypothetical protein COB78_00205 [Hyphomicrobiales bacterium]
MDGNAELIPKQIKIMKKLILIMILIVFSATQGFAGIISADHGSDAAMTSSIDHSKTCHGGLISDINDEDCGHRHSMKGEIDASYCQVDCLLYFVEKFALKPIPPGTHEAVPTISLSGTDIKASFRPPIS